VKKTASKAEPKNLRAKGLAPKRAAQVKGGGKKSGAGSGRVEHADFMVEKYLDKASIILF
jgi:hypothetical protein